MLVLMEIALSDAVVPAGDQGRGAWLSGATQWLEAEAGAMQGSWARQGPPRREQQLCVKGKPMLILCKLNTERPG